MIWFLWSCGRLDAPPDHSCDTELSPAPLRRLTDEELQNVVADLTGVRPAIELLPTTKDNATPRTWAINNTISNAELENLLLMGADVVEQIQWNQHLSCSFEQLTESCVEIYLMELGEKAYRRPLHSQEREILLTPLYSGAALEEALALGTQIILQSPQMLYDDYTSPIHSLSLLFRQRFATEDLLQINDLDELAQVLLEDPKVVDLILDFHHNWLHLYLLNHLTKTDPRYTPELQQSFEQESNLFIADIWWNNEPTFLNLMTNTEAWIDTEIDTLYDHSEVPHWTRVDLGEDRPGLLSRGAFLTAHSYASQTAPIRRGAFILQELLCLNLTPPGDVNMMLEITESGGGIQQQLELHSSDPSCAGCHDQIDPLGIALEQYDHLGLWRETWSTGEVIPIQGTLLNQEYTSLSDLMTIIATSEQGQACYAKHWMEYILARPLTQNDLCALETIQQRFIASGGQVPQLLYDIVISSADWSVSHAD